MVQANRVGGSLPSYKHCLAMIGQYLNQQHARLATITEIENGFMLFFFPDGNYHKQRQLLVSFTDLLELNGSFAAAARGRKGGILQGGANRDRKHPLLPLGYDIVLRAIGHKLDQRQAICMTICETKDKLYLDYWVDRATFIIKEQRRHAVSHHQGEAFDAAGMARLVDVVRESLAQESSRYLGALRLNPYDHLSAMAAAFLLEDEGNYRDAESFFSRIASQVPQHPEAHYHIARLAYIRGDGRTALQEIRRALSIRDDLAASHDLLGRILQQHRKLKDATAAFERAVTLDPDNAILHLRLATAYQAQGRKEDAAREMAQVTLPQAAPGWEMVRENLIEEYSPEPVPMPASRPVGAAAPLAGGSIGSLPAAEAHLPLLPAEEEQRRDSGVVPADWATAPSTVPGAASAAAALPDADATDSIRLTTVFDSQALLPAPAASAQQEVEVRNTAAFSASTPPADGLPPLTPLAAQMDVAGFPEQAPSSIEAPAQAAAAGQGASLAQRLRAAPPGLSGSVPFPPAPTPGTPELRAAPFDPPTPPEAALPMASSPGDASLPTLGAAHAYSSPGGAILPPAASSIPGAMPAAVGHRPARGEHPGAAPRPESHGYAQQQGEPGRTIGVDDAPELPAVELAAEILMIQRALETEPDRADLHRKLGFLLARQGRTAEAATEFRKALQYGRANL